jgi:hypothetical protein
MTITEQLAFSLLDLFQKSRDARWIRNLAQRALCRLRGAEMKGAMCGTDRCHQA